MATTTRALRALPSPILLASALLLGCPTDPMPAPREYRIVASRIPEGLLSVTGTSADDVWVAGSDAGEGPIVLHWDGSAWERRATGATGDLWWVHALAEDDVYLGGEGGLILHWDGASFTRMDTPDDAVIVFGIWAAAPDDVYAVGGAGGGAGFVWHFDGTAWTPVTLPADHVGQSVFKVWGTASDDVWICGFGGILYHFDGAAWTRVDATTTRTLLTLHALGEEVTAVGGAGTGVLVERAEDGTWHDVAPELTPQLMGVWLTPDGGRASGINGTIARRESGAWVLEEHGLDVAEHLHSVWIDDEGAVWSVGGQVLAEPFSDGVIIHQGTEVIPAPSL